MEFKVGDRVRIREDLEVDVDYGDLEIESAMLMYRGKIATITKITCAFTSVDCYKIDLDHELWFWTDEMLEPIDKCQFKLEELEQRIEKLEKCVMGEQKTITKLFTLDRKEPLEIILGESNEETKPSLLTEDERVILRNVGECCKWISRDRIGDLFVYNNKPEKEALIWVCGGINGLSKTLEAFNHLFQFIKWEDDEPYNIEELLKGECGNE